MPAAISKEIKKLAGFISDTIWSFAICGVERGLASEEEP